MEPAGASIDEALLLGAWSGEYVVTRVDGTTRAPFALVLRPDRLVVMGDEEPEKVGRYSVRGRTIVLRGPGDELDFELHNVVLTPDVLRARASVPGLGELFPESMVDLRRKPLP